MFKLRITGRHHAALKSHLFPGDGKEAVALVLCGRRNGAGTHVLMTWRISPVPYNDCRVRTPSQVTWNTDLLEPLLVEASKKGLAILKIHSHPSGFANFSSTDDVADKELFSSIYSWLDDGLPHMSAVMLPDGRILARVVGRDGKMRPVDLISVVGDDLQFWHQAQDGTAPANEYDNKNKQFFGEKTYESLRRLKAAVLGCSGTGSPMTEQLARLGIGELILVDPDVVKEKNLNRILNTTRKDALEEIPKVFALSRAIDAMELGTVVIPLASNLIDGAILRQLAECDVIFGCMDSAEGRYYLNRLAVFYSIPYFDLGVRLDADGKGGVSYACGSVHYLQPDGSSLIGRGMISMDDVAAEGLARRDPAEYERRKHEGYIRNVHVERPAVITINMLIAAMAGNEFIARIHKFRRVDGADSAIRIFDLRENDHIGQAEGAPCTILAQYAGRGDMDLFLDDPAPELQTK